MYKNEYNGEAYEMYSNITKGEIMHICNVLYKNDDNVYYYINRSGYLHILRIIMLDWADDRKLYTIEDLVLTNRGKFAHKENRGEYESGKQAKEVLDKYYTDTWEVSDRGQEDDIDYEAEGNSSDNTESMIDSIEDKVSSLNTKIQELREVVNGDKIDVSNKLSDMENNIQEALDIIGALKREVNGIKNIEE